MGSFGGHVRCLGANFLTLRSKTTTFTETLFFFRLFKLLDLKPWYSLSFSGFLLKLIYPFNYLEQPKGDDYLKVFDQYAPFNNIYVNYDEYDTNSWYWDANFRIALDDPHFADLAIPEDVDMDDFADAVHVGIDNAGIYPDEVEADGYDNEVNVRLTPDYDERNGLEGFERFLDRMSGVDSILGQPDFWSTLGETLIERGLTGGGLKEL